MRDVDYWLIQKEMRYGKKFWALCTVLSIIVGCVLALIVSQFVF